MRPEVLQNEVLKILKSSFLMDPDLTEQDVAVSLDEKQIFELWNILGEELGIDLSMVSTHYRNLLLEYCNNQKSIMAKDFSSLLWLMYYH